MFGAGKCHLDNNIFTVGFGLCRGLLISGHLFELRLDQVVQPEALSGLDVFHHEIGKSVDVAGRPKFQN
jgi:hypothetical protein